MEHIIGQHTIATGKHLTIKWVDIDFGNGKQAVFEMMTFSGDESYPWWAIICAYDDDGREIIMIEQFQVALGTKTFLLPRWGVISGKNILESAQQELLEETWYEASERIQLPTIYSSPWFFEQYTTIFLAKWIQVSEQTAEWDEIEETLVKRVPLTQAVDMIMQWTIVDARTIAGILMAREYLTR